MLLCALFSWTSAFGSDINIYVAPNGDDKLRGRVAAFDPKIMDGPVATLARARELLRDADIILPVPLHPRRFLSRRFNQSAELARHIAQQAAKPFDPSALLRVKLTKQQVGLGA